MAKKFDTQTATNKFFTQDTDNTQEKYDTLNTQDTDDTHLASSTPKRRGRPKKETPLRGYRYNLTLDGDLKAFMKQMAWENHTSVTQYLNDLIRKEKEEFEKNGGTIDPFFEQGE